jgi:hypothetical protein
MPKYRTGLGKHDPHDPEVHKLGKKWDAERENKPKEPKAAPKHMKKGK